jgi:hypothetical protein
MISDEAWSRFGSFLEETGIRLKDADELRRGVEHASIEASKIPMVSESDMAERKDFLRTAGLARELATKMKSKSASWARWVAGDTREATRQATPFDLEEFNQLRNRLLMFLEAATEIADSFKRGRRRDAVTWAWCQSVVPVLERQGIQFRDTRGRAIRQTNDLVYELWHLLPPQKRPRTEERALQIVLKRVLDEREKMTHKT